MTVQTLDESVSCVSLARIMANVEAVRRFVAAGDVPRDTPAWRAIRAVHSPEAASTRPHRRPRLIWEGYAAHGVACALRDLMNIETLDPGCVYTGEERVRLESIVREGLFRLDQVFPEMQRTFREVVAFVVLARKPGHTGGSVSSRPGFVWLAPRAGWTGRECGEHLWHEYLHQYLFLEDMVGTVFQPGASASTPPSARLTPSAIRGVPRRYDQSYHSAFVASGIIEYRARASDIAGARALLPALWLCLDALDRDRGPLTDNGEEQLDRLVERVLRQASEIA